MNEKFPEGPTAEELERQMAQKEKEADDRKALSELLKEKGQDWQEENVATFLKKYEAPEESVLMREAVPEIEKFKEMITDFETTYPLEELHAIVELTREEAPNHPLRAPANNALKLILTSLNTLKSETDISPEQYEELKAEYKRLSRAIGIIGKDNRTVSHE